MTIDNVVNNDRPLALPFGFASHSSGLFRATGFQYQAPDPESLSRNMVEHYLAHRSSYSAGGQLARRIEDTDQHSSVTLVHLAASGATTYKGVVGPYSGRHPDSRNDYWRSLCPGCMLEPQLNSLFRLAAGGQNDSPRDIDMLVLSIGGNDVGFANAIISMIARVGEPGHRKFGPSFAMVKEAIRTGAWNEVQAYLDIGPQQLAVQFSMGLQAETGLEGLPFALDQVANTLSALQEEYDISVKNVVLVGYPDPTWRIDSRGRQATCGNILEGVVDNLLVDSETVRFRITPYEQEFLRSELIEPLRGILEQAAMKYQRQGWSYLDATETMVQGILGNARSHGICGSDPYWPGNPGCYIPERALHGWLQDDEYLKMCSGQSNPTLSYSTRWFRTARLSALIQGPENRQETVGTVHPNEFGHRALSDILFDRSKALLD